MTPAQARALLALMAECYQIASTPEPAPVPEPESMPVKVFDHTNGTVTEKPMMEPKS